MIENIFLDFLKISLRHRKNSLLLKSRNVQKSQSLFLLKLVQHHENTAFGKAHNFKFIKTIEDFRNSVPVHKYSQLEPYIQKMVKGEKNILVSDPLICFNTTSGSTGNAKFVPVTKKSRSKINLANQSAISFLLEELDQAKIKPGKLLFPTSTKSKGKTENNITYSNVSASDLKLSNRLYRFLFAHPFEILGVSNNISRLYLCLLFALKTQNLKIIGATFPSYALTICKILESHADLIIEDIEKGTINSTVSIDSALRETLSKSLKPDPKRAYDLRKIYSQDGRISPQKAWPDLKLIITARGGTSDFYLNKFSQLFGNIRTYGGVYSSAEATYGIHFKLDNDSVLLAIESGFFEFVPEESWEAENPKTLLSHELTPGRRYRILVTNYSGLYRYDVGDIVEVEGYFENNPKIIFRQRYPGFISAVGEKLSESHVTQVINLVNNKYGDIISDYCVTLSNDIPARYWINVEITEQQNPKQYQQILMDIDNFLKQGYPIYDFYRQDILMPPVLRLLKSGSFKRLEDRMIQSGISSTQIKLPKISENRDIFPDHDISSVIKI